MNIVFNLSVCRICMKPQEAGKCLLKDADLKDKFIFATQLTINPKDNLPSIVCDKCVQRLLASYDLIKLARESDVNLRAFISKVGQDFEVFTKTNHEQEEITTNDEIIEEIVAHEEEELPLEHNAHNSSVIILENANDNDHVVKEENGTDALQVDYETFLEDGEYVDENSSNHENVQFMNELILYEEVEEDNASPLIADNDDQRVQIEEPINEVTDNVDQVKRKKRYKTPTGREVRFICLKCNRDFSSRQNLNRHMNTHEGKKPYVCKECGKGFSQNGSLKQHYYTHTGERPYKCETCNRGFTQWKNLSFHMRRHTGEKPFSCEYCGLSFRQKDGLKIHLMKRHMITQQTGSTELHVCALCNQVLETNELLSEHMKRHLNKHRDVVVTVSSEDTQMHSEALHEVDVIEEENPALVDILANTAHVINVDDTTAADPVRAKKYQCRTCFKCFSIMKSLIRHVSIHRSELYKCEECNLAFETKYALKVHRHREHQEAIIDEYECEECELKFKYNKDLNEHLRRVHNLMCQQCPQVVFKTYTALLEHQLDHESN